MSHLAEILRLELTCLITQQKQISEIFRIDTSSFALKANLASLQIEVDKLDINKLVPVLVDLSKLNDVVKNVVVQKTVYDKLVAKVNSIDTSRFILKTKYDTDKSEIENKIFDTSGLVEKTDYNAKITEIEGKIKSISSLATNAALPNISNLVKKQIITQKSPKLKRNLLIKFMINILQLRSLIL